MKNIYSKREFLNSNKEVEMLNEGFLGKVFKSLWTSVVKLSKKIKGSKEINVVYDKYKKLADEAFAKMGNVGAAETATKPAPATEPATPAPTPAKTTPGTTPGTTTESYNFDILNEVAAAPAPADQNKQNTKEQKNLVNLSPEKIAKVSKLTEDRITELKNQFTNEVNGIIKRLSKNPEYSSDKLTQFSEVMKNQFNSYIYDQWYGFYQKAGDQKKLTELTKFKKESDLKYKQSLDALNTKLGEKQQQLQVTSGKKYTYFSKTNNKDIEVNVIGKAIGQDENGQPDAEHNNMWKVKTAANTSFWIPATSFKGEVAPVKKQPATPNKVVVGQTYQYTTNAGKLVNAKVNTIPSATAANVTYTDDQGKSITTAVEINRLKPTPAPAK